MRGVAKCPVLKTAPSSNETTPEERGADPVNNAAETQQKPNRHAAETQQAPTPSTDTAQSSPDEGDTRDAAEAAEAAEASEGGKQAAPGGEAESDGWEVVRSKPTKKGKGRNRYGSL